MKFWVVVLATVAALDVCAQDARGDALEWLKKIAESSRSVSYSGTFFYQHGNRVETSRVVHYVNAAGGVFERLETLDGLPREIIRANDHVTAYIPDAKAVLVERRGTRQLPVMLPENLADLTQQYEVSMREAGRIAGYDCRWISVTPRDKLRYGRRFCAELSSGLPLRAQVFNERAEVIESFAFSQLTLGARFNRDEVSSRYEALAQTQKWRVDRSALNVTEQAADTGWSASNLPAGFRKAMEVKRTIIGRPVA
ncbi:MAG: transcriptional regulator, partial [Betaproteobacteria bacterium]|nr:transcriptional regulator [Betaproteobacteria bacterium]